MSLVEPMVAVTSLSAGGTMAFAVARSETLSWWWVPAAALGAPLALAASLAALVMGICILDRLAFGLWVRDLRRRHSRAR